MTFEDAKNTATIIGVLIATAAFVKAVIEYIHQGVQKRADQFLSIQKRLVENQTFITILELLEFDDPKVSEIPFKDRRELIGLFEEVAIMLNSGLMREAVAYYMFGYFAIDCWDNEAFWKGFNKENTHWFVFRDFVERMKRYGKSHTFRRSEFRF